MKTLKLALSIIAIAILTSGISWGQAIFTETTATIDHMYFGPGIGTVYGTYTYQIILKLNDLGLIESIHWNVIDCDLQNTDGDKVKLTDAGNDTKGGKWDFLNNPALYNTGYPISYDVPDGWLDDIMPDLLPEEGHYVQMACKIICKGTQFRIGAMVQVHMNAHGEVTGEIVKTN